MIRVLALTKYGTDAASTRQRLQQFEPALSAAGFEVEIRPLLDNAYVARLARQERTSRADIVGAYVGRLRQLLDATDFDLLWVNYELFPYWPAWTEKLLARAGRPIIYDIDDAVFHMYDHGPFSAVLKDKIGPLIRSAAEVSAGNAYLARYAERFNDRVTIIPTVVDTNLYQPSVTKGGVPVIGWIGTPSTWQFVRPRLELLRRLCASGAAKLLVVGAGPEASNDPTPGIEFRDWREDREVADVQEMDIGIMPLPDAPWARGKCGYKIVQYMACGVPSIASPVGVNADILVDGITGILASDDAEWSDAIGRLIADPGKRMEMGKAARRRAVKHYSLQSQATRVVDLFRRAANR